MRSMFKRVALWVFVGAMVVKILKKTNPKLIKKLQAKITG